MSPLSSVNLLSRTQVLVVVPLGLEEVCDPLLVLQRFHRPSQEVLAAQVEALDHSREVKRVLRLLLLLCRPIFWQACLALCSVGHHLLEFLHVEDHLEVTLYKSIGHFCEKSQCENCHLHLADARVCTCSTSRRLSYLLQQSLPSSS